MHVSQKAKYNNKSSSSANVRLFTSGDDSDKEELDSVGNRNRVPHFGGGNEGDSKDKSSPDSNRLNTNEESSDEDEVIILVGNFFDKYRQNYFRSLDSFQ